VLQRSILELTSGAKTLSAGTGIQATMATDDQVDAIAAFYRETWDPEATAESVLAARRRAAAENVAAPGDVPPVALIFHASRIVGHCASVPYKLWDGNAEHPAYWLKGLMVLPEYRNGPIGFLVVKELAARLPRSTILTVAPAARRLFSAVGYADLGRLSNFVRPLRGGRLARSLDLASLGLDSLPRWVSGGIAVAQRTGVARVAGAAAGVALRVAAAARRPNGRFITDRASDAPSLDELDELWSRARSSLGATCVRDGIHLRSSFGVHGSELDSHPYTFVTVREGSRLTGIAVLRRPRAVSDTRLQGLRVATVSDIVFPAGRADVGLSLLGGVEDAARAAASDAILCTTAHNGLARLLRRQAYLRLAGNLHFFLRDTTQETQWPQDLASWWLARGDGDADEVF
jgi:hypothetical protein